MQPSRDWLSIIPESPYASEWAWGVPHLRFSPILEATYRDQHLTRVIRRTRTWFALAMSLAIALSLEMGERNGLWHPATLIHVVVMAPAAASLLYVSWSRLYKPYFFCVAPALVSLYSASLGIVIARFLIGGRLEYVAVLTLDLFALFFFCGLLYRHAVAATIATLVSFVLTAFASGTAGRPLLTCTALLLLTAITAAIVKRDVEASYRKSFLESALLGELVSRDGMTGLMNRRAFDDHMRRVWLHALRDKRPIAVLMIDIDHFKQYNDKFGHQAGDAALRIVGRVVQQFSHRPLDMSARYGGEEFAVILYDLPIPHVQDVAERVRVAIAYESGQAVAIEKGRAVTASVGVGCAVPMLGRTPEGIVQLADEALYAAKRAGRNQVVARGPDAYQRLETGLFSKFTKL